MLHLIRGLRAQMYNWYVAGPISWFVMRCPPHRFLSKTSLAKRTLTLRLRTGASIQCRVNEFIAFVEVFVLRDYDVPNLDWQSLKTIVDVGANIGMATIWFAQRAQHAMILAIEPAPAALSLLNSNIAATGLNDRVDVLPLAIGAAAGTGQLQLTDSSVSTAVSISTLSATLDHTVEIITLAQLIRDRGLSSVDLLKLDCEGAEFAILSSASRSILDQIETIVGEYHESANNRADDLKAQLEDHGFQVLLRAHPREPTLGTFVARRQGKAAR